MSHSSPACPPSATSDPQREVEVAVGRVGPRRADVRAHPLRRHEQPGPPLDGDALDGVVAVGRPDPVGASQNAQVDPGSTAGARLDLQVGVAGTQLVEQPVGRQGLDVHRGPVGARCVGAHGLVQVAVVVPLDEVHAIPTDDLAHRAEHVRERLGVGEVEHVLAPRGQWPPPGGAEDPVGMRAHDVGVQVDHLGLEPQPELQAESLDMVDERVQAVGPHLGRDLPVAQATGVVPATAEPAVVEHEPLDADRCRRVGQPPEVVEVGVEVDRLPGVEHEGAWPGAIAGSGPLVAHERPGQAVEPLGRVHEDDRAARCRSRPGASRSSPGASASPPPSTAACGPAPSGSRSTRCWWLPLHATCAAHTSPDRKPKPDVPATISSVAS